MNANDIINLAVPFFVILLVAELLLSWRLNWAYYRLNDTLINMSLGIGRQLVDVTVKAAYLVAYLSIYEAWHWLSLDAAAWTSWLLAFVLVDFVYYWQHRWSHEINLLWAGHLVHHSSEEFNTSVALRQSFLHDLMVYPLFFSLALLGIPPLHFFVAVAVLAIYQYWIHTRAIRRFPEWLERLINTPSNHRVHHGSNKLYVDRNYGGMLMLWDRLFGTWQAETEAVHYGLSKPIKTWNPLWANVAYFVELWRTAARSRQPCSLISIWFRRPGWLPADVAHEPPPPSPRTGHKFNSNVSNSVWRYIIVQYLLMAAIALPLMAVAATPQKLSQLELSSALLFVFWSITNIGGLQLMRPWLSYAEPLRLLCFTTVVPGLLASQAATEFLAIGLALAVAMGLSLFWFLNLRAQLAAN